MNRLTTALIVLAVVAGPPLLAAVWLLHRPWQLPTRAQLQAWAGQPLTAGTIIAGCVAVAGLAWLLFLSYLTRHALTELRRRLRRMRHLPVPTPAQMTASSMAGVAAFALPTATVGHPQPLPATAGTPQPSDPTGSDQHTDRSARAQPPGVDLPGGGWIPYRTAAAITALTAGIWLHRRRSYRPDPGRPREHHTDPDLQPLPDTAIAATVTAITGPDPDREPPRAPAQRLPAGVLLLTGPGAAAAARGLMVEAALSKESTVSVRTDDLGSLPLPTDDAANPTAARLTAGGQHPVAGTVVVLSDEPAAATHRWHVTTDGTATGPDLTEPRRLCTLELQTTVDLLALIRHSQQPTSRANPDPMTTPSQPPAPQPQAPSTETEVRLTLLGGCHLSTAGKPVHLRRTAGLQILAYLAIHHGATRTELTHAVWPHLPPATISRRLHTTLADLRRQLRPLLGEDPITRRDDRYQLNPGAISTDLHQWRTAVYAMTHAVGTTERHQSCRTVIDLYRGDLAAQYTWHWLTPAREQTRRTAIDAYATLADNTDPDQALTLLQQAINIDPYNEALHHQAANLLHAAGDHTGAADLIKRLHHRITAGNPLR